MTPYRDTSQTHASCMICGDESSNPSSLKLAFEADGRTGVKTEFDVTTRHQGYDGLLHGGMTSTLLDAAMTHCLFAQGITAVTAELLVRFVHPVLVGDKVTVSAALTGKRRGIYQLEALICRGQETLAKASAKFIEPKREQN